jgi:hypothetical protein
MLLALLVSIPGIFARSEVVSILGTYEGPSDWYEFFVDETRELGSETVMYPQPMQIKITQQNGSFVRGTTSYM